ncbi:MAG: CoA transferase, partial [Chloroflexi bacterium]|nr:CoA transferase [Chloroflexota bacterium]
GAQGGVPQMVGDNIGDSVPGVWTALGIMMALEARHKTGEGAFVDMAMYDCMVAHTTSTMPYYQATGKVADLNRGNMISAQLALRAKDGYVVLAGAGGPDKWKDLWRLMGRDDLIEDERFLGVGVSGDFYMNSFVPELERWTLERTKAEVTQQLIGIGYSMGMVQNQADLDQCPHLEARGMFINGGNDMGGIFRTVNTPIKFAGGAQTPNVQPPLLGANNEDILCSIGGISPEELKQMQSDGVI